LACIAFFGEETTSTQTARARRDGFSLIVIGAVALVLLGCLFSYKNTQGMEDFDAVYRSTRLLLAHGDPYRLDKVNVYLPTTYLLTLPFAQLPVAFANVLWMALTAGSLIFAAYLIWSLGANYAPLLSGGLIGFLLANSAVVFANGNPAGVAVSLCVMAAWCFLEERFLLVGVLCLACSLALKPQDAGLIWLFSLVAGKFYRRRALQSLAAATVLGLVAVAWITYIAPRWAPEMRANIAEISAPRHGDFNDPGPAGESTGTALEIIDLQSAVSVFKDDPRVYNLVSHLICGVLALAWMAITLKASDAPRLGWFALAAAAPLTLLVAYHRPYDAKLLLLVVPACAMLWSEGGPVGWMAFLVNAAGMVLSGEFSIAFLNFFVTHPHAGHMRLAEKLSTVLLFRPTSLVLLVMAIFNLWVYGRRALKTGMAVESKASPAM
jgi:hypothetical protein